MFEIEKNVPLPERKANTSKYPFNSMEIGDSFAVPADIKGTVMNAATTSGRYHGKKFSARQIDENTARIWRTA